jgi:hypothetical protein
MDPQALAAALEASALGAWARDGWHYPIVNVLHLIGLALLVGPIVLLDLRLLGFGRAFAPDAVSAAVTPLAAGGLLLMLASGIALLVADAAALAANRMLLLKLLLVALGLANAIAFRVLYGRHLVRWQQAVPLPARVQASLSILTWGSALVAGRLIAYV